MFATTLDICTYNIAVGMSAEMNLTLMLRKSTEILKNSIAVEN
jgi:hypothetical protein